MTNHPLLHRLAPEAALDIHPAAKFYPLGDIEPLLESIRLHGQQQPGILYRGQLLDGRRRLRVTRSLQVEFLYTEVEDLGGLTPLEFVMAANQARNLSPSQRALVAARARPEFAAARQNDAGVLNRTEAAATPMPNVQGKTRDLLGRLFEVDGKLVDAASAVLDQGQRDLVRAVHQGALGVMAARKLLKLSAAEQQQAASAALSGDNIALRALTRRCRASASSADARETTLSHQAVAALRDAARTLERFLVTAPDTHAEEVQTFLSLAARIIAKLSAPTMTSNAAVAETTEMDVVDQFWAGKP